MDVSQWIVSALGFALAFLLQRQKDALRDNYERELRAENADLKKQNANCNEVKDQLYGDIADLREQVGVEYGDYNSEERALRIGVEYGDYNSEERALRKRKRLEEIEHPPPLTEYEQQQRDGEMADWAKDDPDGLGEDSHPLIG